MQPSKLTRNTAVLFGRQIIFLTVNLYSIRVLLATFGVADFALYNVILNVVLLSSFLTSALSTITQRYISFALGTKKNSILQEAHDSCLTLTALFASISVIGLATLGYWFVTNELSVDPSRATEAEILFYLLTAHFTITLISSFYSSIIMAHEDMHVFAIIATIDAFLRLLAVFTIKYISLDHIITYGILLNGSALIVFATYYLYCTRRYDECSPRNIRLNISNLYKMIHFSGWTIFGQITTISRHQAVTILINQSFNPITVAARAISVSIATQVLTFANNFTAALNPPIIKAHAAGEKKQMFNYIFTGSRIAFYLIWMATLPIVAFMPGILSLWLREYPEQTVLFTRLALVENAIVAISFPLMTAVRATGKVRGYELSLGALQILIFVLSWLTIRAGAPAYFVYVAAICVNLAMLTLRIFLSKHLLELPIIKYARNVLLPILLVSTISSSMVFGILHLAPGAENLDSNLKSIVAAATIFTMLPVVILVFGLSKLERNLVVYFVRSKLWKSRGA